MNVAPAGVKSARTRGDSLSPCELMHFIYLIWVKSIPSGFD